MTGCSNWSGRVGKPAQARLKLDAVQVVRPHRVQRGLQAGPDKGLGKDADVHARLPVTSARRTGAPRSTECEMATMARMPAAPSIHRGALLADTFQNGVGKALDLRLIGKGIFADGTAIEAIGDREHSTSLVLRYQGMRILPLALPFSPYISKALAPIVLDGNDQVDVPMLPSAKLSVTNQQ